MTICENKTTRKTKKINCLISGTYEECLNFFCELACVSSVIRPHISINLTNMGEMYEGKIVCKVRSSKQLKILQTKLNILVENIS